MELDEVIRQYRADPNDESLHLLFASLRRVGKIAELFPLLPDRSWDTLESLASIPFLRRETRYRIKATQWGEKIEDDSPCYLNNWNYPQERAEAPDYWRRVDEAFWKPFCDWLEEDGALEWSDQHSTCCGCSKIVRTDPDGWSWEPGFIVTESELLCLGCAWNDLPYDLEARLARVTELHRGFMRVEWRFERRRWRVEVPGCETLFCDAYDVAEYAGLGPITAEYLGAGYLIRLSAPGYADDTDWELIDDTDDLDTWCERNGVGS